MSLTIKSLLLLATAPMELGEPVYVPASEVVQRLHECGFVEVSSAYEDLLQDDVISIEDPEASDAQLECAAHVAISTTYFIEMPEKLASDYYEHLAPLQEYRNKQFALRRLSEQGRLHEVPEYREGETDDAVFARRLEELCGDEATGALQSAYGPHAISPTWTIEDDRGFEETGKALYCIMTFAAAAGFDMYLIGNEKVANPE